MTESGMYDAAWAALKRFGYENEDIAAGILELGSMMDEETEERRSLQQQLDAAGLDTMGAPTPQTLALAQREHTWSRVKEAMRQGTVPLREHPWLSVSCVVPERHRDEVARRLGLAGWAVRWGRHGGLVIADRRIVEAGHGG